MGDKPQLDSAMENVRARYAKSGMSLDELGLKMGYPKESARKSAWQFLNGTNDPRLSMLRKFAEAVGCSVKSLV
jgi:transcriptional regulator with XRE-family HTH domain